MESVGPSRCPGGDHRSYPPVPWRHAGSGAHGRRGTLGLVRGYAGIETRMCAISATVQHFLCSGDRGRSCAFQRGRHDPKGSGVPRRGGWGGGGDTVRTRAEGGLGNVSRFMPTTPASYRDPKKGWRE